MSDKVGGTVLVTDGEHRASLAVVRSLGRAGFRVIVGSPRKHPLAGRTRFAEGVISTADPLARPEEWCSQVRTSVETHGVDVLLPVTDASIMALLDSPDPFPTVIPLPPAQSYARVSNKKEILALANNLGIGTPRQWIVADREDGVPTGVPPHLFPVVVKPSRSVVDTDGVRSKTRVSYAADRVELQETLSSLPDGAFPILLQERIRGPGIGVFLLFWDGEVKAHFGHRRLREKPPSGGVSVLRESVLVPDNLLRDSSELLKAVGWRGVAMVEYKVDETSSRPVLMEINGRFWGSLQLAIDSGVDFPTLLVHCALGKDIPRLDAYRQGVKTRWILGDLDHLIAVFRQRKSDGDDPGSRTKALFRFLTEFDPRTRSEVFSWTDPGPFLQEGLDWLRGR